MSDQPRLTRRDLLRRAGVGLGAAAVSGAAGIVPAGARPVLGGSVDAGEPLRLARVWPATSAQAAALWSFDDTHMGWPDGSIELLLWPGDLARLDGLGIRYQITVADLQARDAALRAAAPPPTTMGVPGETGVYRRLGDDLPADGELVPTYYDDLRHLASTYPDKVQLFTLPLPSIQGRTVYGIEVCTDVARRDGRPVFYMDGLHHAREWPAGEFTLMFAFDLVENYGSDSRITDIMDTIRTVLVPVQNPDGYVRSRDAATSLVSAHTPVNTPLLISEFEYHRKNMRRHNVLPENIGSGTDTNRNYSFQWGGDGSSGSATSQTYRGSSPFNEPECENIRRLLNSIHAITLNSNHTFGRLVLRPPGARAFQFTPDETILRELGDIQGDLTGYRSQPSYDLYDTTGTTMDWAYGTHGTLAYTYEHATSFHPNYSPYIPSAYAEGGVREAFLVLAEAAGNPDHHSVITGRVVDADGQPVPGTIRVTKEWNSPLWRNADGTNPTGEPFIAEWVDTAMETEDGSFAFHVNPSARPYEVDYEPIVPYTVTVVTDVGEATRLVDVERGKAANLGDIVVA